MNLAGMGCSFAAIFIHNLSVRTGTQQQLYQLIKPGPGGHHERRHPLLVAGVHRGPVLQKMLGYLGLIMKGGEMKSRITGSVDCINPGIMKQEGFHHIQVPLAGGSH